MLMCIQDVAESDLLLVRRVRIKVGLVLDATSSPALSQHSSTRLYEFGVGLRVSFLFTESHR